MATPPIQNTIEPIIIHLITIQQIIIFTFLIIITIFITILILNKYIKRGTKKWQG